MPKLFLIDSMHTYFFIYYETSLGPPASTAESIIDMGVMQVSHFINKAKLGSLGLDVPWGVDEVDILLGHLVVGGSLAEQIMILLELVVVLLQVMDLLSFQRLLTMFNQQRACFGSLSRLEDELVDIVDR